MQVAIKEGNVCQPRRVCHSVIWLCHMGVCVCAVSNHNLRHWQQVWGRGRGRCRGCGTANSFQFHLVGRVIDAPVAVEDGGNDLGYLPRYYVNGSSGSTVRPDRQTIVHACVRSRQSERERETDLLRVVACNFRFSFIRIACMS